MPVKHRIRHKANSTERRGGLIQGSKPHRERNAHKVNRKKPYFRAMFIWLCCTLIIFLAIATLAFGINQKNMKFVYMGITLVGLWIFMRVVYLLACKATTCPLCRAPHLVNGKSHKHKKAYKIFPFSYATTAIFTATLSMCIRCMHCGVTFDLNKKNR